MDHDKLVCLSRRRRGEGEEMMGLSLATRIDEIFLGAIIRAVQLCVCRPVLQLSGLASNRQNKLRSAAGGQLMLSRRGTTGGQQISRYNPSSVNFARERERRD